MGSVVVVPAIAFIAGAACGIRFHVPGELALPCVGLSLFVAIVAFRRRAAWVVFGAVAAGGAVAAAALAGHALGVALYPGLRNQLDGRAGAFAIDSVPASSPPNPIMARMRVEEDAAVRDGFVSVRVDVVALRLDDEWTPAAGSAALSIGGSASALRAGHWRRGRLIEAPVTFRRPVRYLNTGVPDFERQLAMSGTALFGSVKSGLLVDVVEAGSRFDELTARARAHTRRAVSRFVGRHSEVSAAIVTAVLIGDRAGLPDELRATLQAAGTYHVIAISGGNIAILASLTFGVLTVCGLPRRAVAGVTMLVLLTYAVLVAGEPSVWRATVMALTCLFARLLDQRVPARQAIALAALLLTARQPLDIVDPGYLLTFGATWTLLETGRYAPPRSSLTGVPGRFAAWIVSGVVASCAIEVALLPIGATTFSQVTAAGVILNLAAIPAMAITQSAGMIVAGGAGVESLANAAGWVAHVGAETLVRSAGLVDAAPWVTARVPPPSWWVIAVYYAGLSRMVVSGRRGLRVCGGVVWSAAATVLVCGLPAAERPPAGMLRLTMFDVGQGDAMLLDLPDRRTVMVDAGGAPFGGGAFDIGARVLAPALWARGVRRLDTLLITHPDPDHIGGALALAGDFTPREVWEGISVPRSAALARLHDLARRRSIPVRTLRSAQVREAAAARLRVLHPPEPEWERRNGRNDDSVVLEIVYGDVALLLTGDIGADIEREILPKLTPARFRVLKVAHHGSRTSSSATLLDGWRPHVALISCGRANTFGHPAPAVVSRLEGAGARIYRTDRDGEITLTTDGGSVQVTTYAESGAP